MKITPHFTFEELTRTDKELSNSIYDNPNPEVVQLNLFKMAVVLERFRWFINQRCIVPKSGSEDLVVNQRLRADCPIIVSSCYRTRVVNAAVGGKLYSKHLSALAFDIRTLVTDSCELYALWTDFVDSFVSEIFDVLNLEFNYAYKIDNDSIHVDFRLKSI